MPRSVVDAGHGFEEIRRLFSVYKRYLFTGTARSSVTPVPTSLIRYYIPKSRNINFWAVYNLIT